MRPALLVSDRCCGRQRVGARCRLFLRVVASVEPSPLLPLVLVEQRRTSSSSAGGDDRGPMRFGAGAGQGTAAQQPPPPVPVPRSMRKFNERGHRQEPDDEPLDWTEPTLRDLDRSIPQVDCRFLAEIINLRNLQRNDFLQQQENLVTMKNVGSDDSSSAGSSSSSIGSSSSSSGGSGRDEQGAAGVAGGRSGRDERSTASDDDPEEVKSLLKPLPDERDELAERLEGVRYRPEYDDGFVIIDCRTVDEVTSWGMVEGAKLLPAHDLFEALHMSPEDFHENFGFAKPAPEDKLIFYCMYGPRSLMAAQIASWMGYESVMHLRDGYYEWAKQFNLLVRRWRDHDEATGNNSKRLGTFQLAKELARDVAPEFNHLVEAEASRYRLDPLRSTGTLIVGETVLEKAQRQLEEQRAKLLAPPPDPTPALGVGAAAPESNT